MLNGRFLREHPTLLPKRVFATLELLLVLGRGWRGGFERVPIIRRRLNEILHTLLLGLGLGLRLGFALLLDLGLGLRSVFPSLGCDSDSIHRSACVTGSPVVSSVPTPPTGYSLRLGLALGLALRFGFRLGLPIAGLSSSKCSVLLHVLAGGVAGNNIHHRKTQCFNRVTALGPLCPSTR